MENTCKMLVLLMIIFFADALFQHGTWKSGGATSGGAVYNTALSPVVRVIIFGGITNFVGTGFFVSSDYVVTAGHVLEPLHQKWKYKDETRNPLIENVNCEEAGEYNIKHIGVVQMLGEDFSRYLKILSVRLFHVKDMDVDNDVYDYYKDFAIMKIEKGIVQRKHLKLSPNVHLITLDNLFFYGASLPVCQQHYKTQPISNKRCLRKIHIQLQYPLIGTGDTRNFFYYVTSKNAALFGSSDSQDGDSGGPLLINPKSGKTNEPVRAIGIMLATLEIGTRTKSNKFFGGFYNVFRNVSATALSDVIRDFSGGEVEIEPPNIAKNMAWIKKQDDKHRISPPALDTIVHPRDEFNGAWITIHSQDNNYNYYTYT